MNALLDTKLTLHSLYVDDSVMDEFKRFMGEDGDSLEKELIVLYLKQTPKLVADINNEIRDGKIDALKVHIHSLKGSSGQLGVTGITDYCKDIEEALRQGNLIEADRLIIKLKEVYRQVEEFFTAKL
jgi:HPt (histidine-containing phosphotransfer) domain-containing protein